MPIIKLSKIITGFHSKSLNPKTLQVLVAVTVIMMAPVGAYAKTVVEWDFSKSAHDWTGNGRVENLRS